MNENLTFYSRFLSNLLKDDGVEWFNITGRPQDDEITVRYTDFEGGQKIWQNPQES